MLTYYEDFVVHKLSDSLLFLIQITFMLSVSSNVRSTGCLFHPSTTFLYTTVYIYIIKLVGVQYEKIYDKPEKYFHEVKVSEKLALE